MSSKISIDLQSLQKQQNSLRQRGRLSWIHWLILGMSVVITLIAWNFSDSMLRERAENQFDREAHSVVEQIRIRLSHYEDALTAGSATMLSNQGIMSREEWRDYANALDLPNRYPGVNGIGVIREVKKSAREEFEFKLRSEFPGFKIYPEHDFIFHLPIVYIEPEQQNWAAIGLDVAFEENRRAAANLARDLGTTQISGPITLVQDEARTPGFLFFAPFYLQNTGFEGLIYSPLVVKNFVESILGDSPRHIYFSIHDGEQLLYDESSNYEGSLNNSTHTVSVDATFYGRAWRFTINSAPAFSSATDKSQPLLVLISGLTIDVLLLALFLMLTQSNRRVLDLAENMINKLGMQTSVLTAKNVELESFAYIVSHDLKTPIRSIQNLSVFLKEDIKELGLEEGEKSSLTDHIELIDEQIERSHSLINGVLEFSRVGNDLDTTENVDVISLIRSIGTSLGIANHQLAIDTDVPPLNTHKVQLSQVFENLIGNAYKYHPTPSSANIVIWNEVRDSYYRFYVSDNGNGIDRKYRERIFKPFTTIEVANTPNSSGVGLSIVKKSVEMMGGSVGIIDQEQQGSTFYFDWPICHSRHYNEELEHAA